jgi:hypothetical protein
MEQRPSWEANRSSSSQKILRILWNPKVHYRIHNSSLPALSWARSIQSVPLSHLCKIRFNIILPFTLGYSSCVFPSDFPTKILYVHLLSHIRATCPVPNVSSDWSFFLGWNSLLWVPVVRSGSKFLPFLCYYAALCGLKPIFREYQPVPFSGIKMFCTDR